MTLDICPECSAPVSDQAHACPECGHPINPPPPPQIFTDRGTPWYFSTILVILALLFCWPVGLVLMWLGNVWPLWVRSTVSAFIS